MTNFIILFKTILMINAFAAAIYVNLLLASKFSNYFERKFNVSWDQKPVVDCAIGLILTSLMVLVDYWILYIIWKGF